MSKSAHQQQRAAGKRKADDDLPTGGHTSKRPTVEPGAGSSAPKLANGQSEEDLFKIRHAAEFDTESVGPDDYSQVQVKQEGQDRETPAVSRMHLRSATATPHRVRPSYAQRTPQTAGAANSSRPGEHQDGIFIAILSQSSWDDKMTKTTVENLSQRAQQVASAGQLFDVAYVDSIIEQLDRSSIENERRSQVIGLL